MYIDLSGRWFVAPSAAGSFAEAKAPVSSGEWIQTALPNNRWTAEAMHAKPGSGPFQDGPCVWARTIFTLSAEQAAMNATLTTEMCRWGYEAFVNGKSVGLHEHQGPGSLKIPRGAMREGENELILKVRNWCSLRKVGAKQWPYFPAGGSVFNWGGISGGIFGRIGIHLYRAFRIRSVIMKPDPAKSTASAVVRIDGCDSLPDDLLVEVVVRRPGSTAVLGKAKKSFSAGRSLSGPVEVMVKLVDFDWWRPEDTKLTQAAIKVSCGCEMHEHTAAFGMRSFVAGDGDFLLNGKPYTILGSNVVTEWLWSADYYHNINGAFSRYMELARGMNVAAIRTHTTPPLEKVATLCDTSGMLILAEMPFTYNYQAIGFSAEEACEYHRIGKAQSLAWIEQLANHPSIIMWVSTNEAHPNIGSFDQTGWDISEMIPAIKALDPTRPVLRSGEESPDIQDIHNYEGFWSGTVGDYYEIINWHVRDQDGKRPIGNTEYIEGFPPDRIHRWLGTRERSEETDKYYAMVGMRQTEILRRCEYDLVLPYMLHGWTKGNWRPYAPTPMYGALHNALAPVAVSLDFPDRNYVSGAKKSIDVWLVNDRNNTAKGTLKCFVFANDPEFSCDARAFKGTKKAFARKVTVGGRGRKKHRVTFSLPVRTGRAWLAAVFEPQGLPPVMSQREICIMKVPVASTSVRKHTFRVIGANDRAKAWFRQMGLNARFGIPFGRYKTDADMLIIWENIPFTYLHRHTTDRISDFLSAGRSVLIMQQHNGWNADMWHWNMSVPDMAAISYSSRLHRSSLAMPEDSAIAAKIWKNLGRTGISHPNGLHNAVCYTALGDISAGEPLPAYSTPSGWSPTDPKAVMIDCANRSDSTFEIDREDPLHTFVATAGLTARSFARLRSRTPSLLCTSKPSKTPYMESYPFMAEAGAEGILWVFEQGRKWASPFQWRIDDGDWQTAGPDIAMVKPEQLAEDGPTFAWSRLGTVKVQAGTHVLQVKASEPNANGNYLLSQDCFMISPSRIDRQIVARTGDGLPVMTHMKIAEAELIMTQLLIADRLSHSSDIYDPAIEQLMLNLLELC